jgi:hypothetical protein
MQNYDPIAKTQPKFGVKLKNTHTTHAGISMGSVLKQMTCDFRNGTTNIAFSIKTVLRCHHSTLQKAEYCANIFPSY